MNVFPYSLQGVSDSVPQQKTGVKSQSREIGSSGLGVKRLKMTEPELSSKQPASSSSLPNTGVPKGYTAAQCEPVQNFPPTSSYDRGPGVDLPETNTQSPLIQGLPNQLSHLPSPAQVTHPPDCHMTGSDVIKEHPTADTIIEEYWKQRKVLEPGSQTTNPSTSMSGGFDNAQSMFSAGNFSSLPIPGGTGPGRGGEQGGAGVPTSVDDQHPLTNVNLSRILPTLEALAGSLQDPNSLESRYLAALASHTQLGMPGTGEPPLGENPPLLSNGLDALPHSNDEEPPGQVPASALDTPALLSSADIASLLPSLANFDPSAGDYLPQQVEGSGQPDTQQPIYPTNYFHSMKQLSDRMQSIAASVGQEGAGERGLKAALPQQEQSSLLLDSNFSMDDIPPPDNFVPAEHVSCMCMCMFMCMCYM